MQIHHLHLHSNNLSAQFHFYTETLGFSCQYISEDAFELHTQENKIVFQYHQDPVYYHFAFLIPTGTIDSAINYLESRGIKLLPYKKEKIIQFTDGQAIYFYDQDQNIAEFIERPLLNYPPSDQFSIEQIIKLNEIGLPVANPLMMANTLAKEYGILPSNNPPFTERFCWVGDHNGVIIVTQLGRHWLPTNHPGVINDFTIRYSDQGKDYHLKFRDNEILAG